MSAPAIVIFSAGLAALGWGWLAAAAVRRLTPLPGLGAGEAEPQDTASIVVAARNEADHVAAAARTWLGQEHVRHEVIVVDDRSSDGTGAALRDLVAADARLAVVRVEDRPDDWLGKCHALQRGLDAARGDWVLFCDADVELAPDALARALAVCRREGADALALVPRAETDTVLQWAMTAAFFQAYLVGVAAHRANRDDGACAAGVGAFNLVRRRALLDAGGFAPIRLQVGDDVALMRLLVNAGHRHRLHDGHDVARVHWQRGGAWATVKGLEKNAYWALRLSPAWLVAFTAAAAFLFSPLAAPVIGGAWAWAGLAAWVLGGALPWLAWRGRRRALLPGLLLLPASAVLLVLAAWNSALSAWRCGGLRWRDDVLPLADLRAALKPLGWWLGKEARRRARPPRSGPRG